jgi:ABC-type multidrug transport system ATPase subunit
MSSATEGYTVSWENIVVEAKPRILDSLKFNKQKLEKLKEPIELWRQIRDRKSKEIVRNVSGIVQPGQMIALMGASGSGKTTLLNAINFRIKGNLKLKSGKIRINGVKATAATMAQVACFVQQQDLFFPLLTVKEHLMFQATLRLGLDKRTTQDRVSVVIKQVNLSVGNSQR